MLLLYYLAHNGNEPFLALCNRFVHLYECSTFFIYRRHHRHTDVKSMFNTTVYHERAPSHQRQSIQQIIQFTAAQSIVMTTMPIPNGMLLHLVKIFRSIFNTICKHIDLHTIALSSARSTNKCPKSFDLHSHIYNICISPSVSIGYFGCRFIFHFLGFSFSFDSFLTLFI